MITTLLIVALILAVTRLALFLTLHIVGRGHYSPVKHAVSDYAVGPTRRLASAMNAVTAALFAASPRRCGGVTRTGPPTHRPVSTCSYCP